MVNSDTIIFDLVEPVPTKAKPTEITISMPIDLELFRMLLRTANAHAKKRKKQISMKTQDGKTIITIEA